MPALVELADAKAGRETKCEETQEAERFVDVELDSRAATKPPSTRADSKNNDGSLMGGWAKEAEGLKRGASLRERVEDIPALADHFVRSFAQRYRKQAESIEPAALQWMQSLAWPGNVRELQTVLERAVLHAAPEQRVLTRADFAFGEA